MSSPIRNVALAEWSWMGHHPMYFKLFIRALLDLGCTVLALCPQPEEVDAALLDLGETERQRLTCQRINWAEAPHRCPSRFRRTAETFCSVYEIRHRIRQWETTQRKAMELIFFACVYDVRFWNFWLAEWLLPCQWAGLYLHCRSFRMPGSITPQVGELPCPERIFRSSRLHAIAVLDEGVAPALERFSGRPVIVFPDMTDEEVPREASPLAAQLKRFASGAPIVAALGNLQHTKGVTTLARVALDPANSDLCFAFIGRLEWATFKMEDRVLLEEIVAGRPNIYTHFDHVPEERSFNDLIRECQVVFAAYLNFPNSSGILTKAAVFQKPIIVSDGYLMAERVRKYRLGEVVPEGDEKSAIRAIREICGLRGDWIARQQPNWHDYRRVHCYDRLKHSLFDVLSADDTSKPIPTLLN